jgi:FixJ family two-component response regulator
LPQCSETMEFMVQPLADIAIVDDDASVCRALARLIETWSFRARTYGSAREFIDSMEEDGKPDCLVVDLQMPDMNGLDLQDHLRRAGCKIPTIIITAHNEPGFRRWCEAAEVSAYLLKPLNNNELMTAIKSAVKH